MRKREPGENNSVEVAEDPNGSDAATIRHSFFSATDAQAQ